MQTWWGVFEKDAQEPFALFKHKTLAIKFGKEPKLEVKPIHFYETEEEADFLSMAEPIWED